VKWGLGLDNSQRDLVSISCSKEKKEKKKKKKEEKLSVSISCQGPRWREKVEEGGE